MVPGAAGAGRTVEGLPSSGVADCACAEAAERIEAPTIKPSDAFIISCFLLVSDA